MPWQINFIPHAEKQLRKLDTKIQKRILQFLHLRIINTPEPQKLGKALVGTHQDLYRFRIGNYRILCHIYKENNTILIVAVGHRNCIYN